MNRARATIAALAGGAAALLAGACKQEAPAPAAVPPPAAVAAPPAAAVAAPAEQVRWATGVEYTYQLALASRMSVGAAANQVDFALEARLALTPYRSGPEGLGFHGALREIAIEAGANQHQAQYKELAVALARPFLFTLTEGRLSELRVPPGQARFAVSIQQTAAAALQWAVGPGTAERWTTREHDATGPYQVAYQRTGPGRYTKTKLKYDGVVAATSGNTPMALEPKVTASQARLQIDGGRLRSLEARDGLQIAFGQMGDPMTSETTLSLTLSADRPAATPPEWQALAAVAIQVTPTKPYVEPVRDSDFDDVRIGDLTFAKALVEAEAQQRDPKRDELWESKNGVAISPEEKKIREARLQARSKVFSALVGWFRRDPRTVAQAVKAVRRRSPAASFLMDALSSSGTPLCQQTLVTLMNDARLGEVVRKEAATSLLRTKTPTIETVAALQARLDDPLLSTHAIYGLGSMSRRRREAGDAAGATALAEVLLARLATETRMVERIDLLRGLANSAHPGVLPALEKAMADPDDRIQRTAIEALAPIQRPEVDPLIARYLEHESGPVRVAALEAARGRSPSDLLAAAVDRVAREAPDRPSRLQALRILDRWLNQRPELQGTIDRLAKDEPDEMIRRVAQASVQARAATR